MVKRVAIDERNCSQKSIILKLNKVIATLNLFFNVCIVVSTNIEIEESYGLAWSNSE